MRPVAVFGRPDFLFPDRSLAVFVDGCFWHGCPHCGHTRKKRSAYWIAKMHGNTELDLLVSKKLTLSGFAVIRFWEHELRDELPACIQRIAAALHGG